MQPPRSTAVTLPSQLRLTASVKILMDYATSDNAKKKIAFTASLEKFLQYFHNETRDIF